MNAVDFIRRRVSWLRPGYLELIIVLICLGFSLSVERSRVYTSKITWDAQYGAPFPYVTESCGLNVPSFEPEIVCAPRGIDAIDPLGLLVNIAMFCVAARGIRILLRKIPVTSRAG